MVIVLTDEAVLAAVAAGDPQAFGVLWERYGGAVVSVAQRIVGTRDDAEDVAQDVFTTIWRRAAAFDPQRGDAGGWIHAIARNRALDQVRRRPPTLAADLLPETVDRSASTEDVVAAELEAFRVHRALAALDDDLRMVVQLAYVDGLSQTEIAERVGWPLGTVKTRTRRALALLASTLSPAEEVAR